MPHEVQHLICTVPQLLIDIFNAGVLYEIDSDSRGSSPGRLDPSSLGWQIEGLGIGGARHRN